LPLKIQRAVLDLIIKVTCGTPAWLLRPGRIECGKHWPLICNIYRELTGLELPEVMPTNNRRTVDGILKCGKSQRIVEVDESQHFNCYRGNTLRLYPEDVPLAFDRETWIVHSQAEPRQNAGGWAKPKPPLFPHAGGRHRERAFRDALADILPPGHGFHPTLRIADFEVKPWIETASAPRQMKALLTRKMTN
jgi:hypothetical protein